MHVYIDTVEKSRTAASDKNTNSCPETFNKTVTGYIFYHTSKILQTRKLQKSIFRILFVKTSKGVTFTVDSSAFQTFITLPTKKTTLLHVTSLLSELQSLTSKLQRVLNVISGRGSSTVV